MQPDSIKRRVFIGRVATKAAYVAPAVLALKAAQTAYAGPSGCGLTGSPCNVDADCCPGMGFKCEDAMMSMCMGAPDCTCQ